MINEEQIEKLIDSQLKFTEKCILLMDLLINERKTNIQRNLMHVAQYEQNRELANALFCGGNINDF